MITLQPLTQLASSDFLRIATGYYSHSTYNVLYADTDTETTFALKNEPLPEPYIKKYQYSEADILKYRELLGNGYCWGAYQGDLLIGLILAEPHAWNQSVWVWEFHVAENWRRQGIGRQLMEKVVAQAEGENKRIIVCETQNTNAPAIRAYRQLNFHVEGIDISYYSNDDYPNGETAVFLKRRIEQSERTD